MNLRHVIALLVISLFSVQPALAADALYDKVMKNGTIRCGYVIFPPFLMKEDGKTLSGVSYDAFNAMGNAMGLKVEWVEEVPWDNLIAGLDSGRIDAICSFLGVSAQRMTRADFLTAPLYSVEGVWVRRDEKRFTKNEQLDSPDVTFAATEGTMFGGMVANDFPKAKLNSLPGTTSFTEQLLTVTTGKADATIMDNYVSLKYLEANPNAIKEVQPGRIYRVLPVSSMIPMGEVRFKIMLNGALDEIINNGVFDKIYDKYNVPKGSVLKRANGHMPAE
ncbi:MAG: transporter substrate-binding domain-containing protein [Alphaproteobacteria bacterium]|nr:transporter substrate-binding domain-containing protein [Alphaproteobacteria bacterium]